MYKVFLDLDGVLADFVTGICEAHGRQNPYTDPKNFKIFDMEKIWGIMAQEFWEPTKGYEFWASLGMLEDAEEILEVVESQVGRENICLLTAPSLDKDCIKGKLMWIEKHLPNHYRSHVFFGSKKHFFAGPNKILIDDRDRNTLDFQNNGGLTVLVPRPWNVLYKLRNNTVGTIASDLEEIIL